MKLNFLAWLLEVILLGHQILQVWLSNVTRLKKLGATTPYDLNDLYHRHICSTLEYATRVWHFSLTNEDTLKFERIQKSALHIILGEG